MWGIESQRSLVRERMKLLLTEGTVAIVEAEELLGEMDLFGNGVHSADVKVLDEPEQLIAIYSDQLLKAMLFDADLSIELLSLISQRCLQGNEAKGSGRNRVELG